MSNKEDLQKLKDSVEFLTNFKIVKTRILSIFEQLKELAITLYNNKPPEILAIPNQTMRGVAHVGMVKGPIVYELRCRSDILENTLRNINSNDLAVREGKLWVRFFNIENTSINLDTDERFFELNQWFGIYRNIISGVDIIKGAKRISILGLTNKTRDAIKRSLEKELSVLMIEFNDTLTAMISGQKNLKNLKIRKEVMRESPSLEKTEKALIDSLSK
ncbi:MAG: hypothetical protein PHW96_01660 [Candidatus Nanoarchaeia archaeon]|nr:hypothetical protein [Candidatus Nanoarchaeia archaeon]